jgi:hypothetical protein
VWAYPLETHLATDEMIEGVVSGEHTEQLAYRGEWDELAIHHDLAPGEMMTWPQHTPHRAVNLEGLNVVLATEHMSPRAVRRNNVLLANRHFRQLLGGAWRRTELDGWRPALKEFTLGVTQRIPGLAPTQHASSKRPISFEVDLDAPGCVRPIAAARVRESALA